MYENMGLYDFPHKMSFSRFIILLGHTKAVLIITVFSVLFSIILNLAIFALIDEKPTFAAVINSAIIPLIVAPVAAWPICKLLFRIHEMETVMREHATTDMLTGFLSRRAFLDNAKMFYELAKRERISFVVATVDLDDFKKINDTFGHASGDAVLSSFGEIANSLKRKSDLVGRMGGEEFILILPNCDQQGAEEFTNRLHFLVNKTLVKTDNQIINFSISIGIAMYDPESCKENLEHLFKYSDQAMYRSKAQGKGLTSIHNENDLEEKLA